MITTSKPDYWSLLGISPDSDLNQLKRAFRKEARKWHPDLNKDDINAEERFKLINEAYEVLSDPRKRLVWEKNNNYDNKISNKFENGFPSYEKYISVILGIDSNDEEHSNVKEFDNEDDDLDFNDEEYKYKEENNLTNKDCRPATSTTSQFPIKIDKDLETIVELEVEEALNGANVEIELNDGTIVEITTPPFAGDGWRLRLEGVAFGGKDHFIQLRVLTPEGLRIDGLRVFYRLELFPPEAVLGCAVEIPTLDGDVTLQVPPNSSSGRLLRLKGRGLNYNEIKGDQFVEIVIVMPMDIKDSELALYKRLQELSNE